MKALAWTVTAPNEPMRKETREIAPGPGEVVIEVAGCGVCHTDLGFYFDGILYRDVNPELLLDGCHQGHVPQRIPPQNVSRADVVCQFGRIASEEIRHQLDQPVLHVAVSLMQFVLVL